MQGDHECEIFESALEAAEGEERWQSCTKNPGHRDFIPVKDFTMRHLPPDLRDQQTFSMFKAIADLTVRLRVQYTSEDRPDDDQLSALRGTDKLRTGSGLITGITPGQGECPCYECKWNPGRQFWWVYLRTACHVAFDSKEAKLTKVDLFYDDEHCISDGTMKSLYGFDLEMLDASDDFCIMRCILHDESLFQQLQSYTHSSRLGMDFKMTWFTMWGRSEFLNHFIVLIVSHPHGKSKRVTIGKMKHVDVKPSEEREKSYILECYGPVAFQYATATCRGSSGAPIVHLCIPITIRKGDMTSTTSRPIRADGWVHSGVLPKDREDDANSILCCVPRTRSKKINHSCLVNSFNQYWKLV
ncbi:hypothetical protein EGW08_000335, partial [Elysia chlorotica]